jgi:LmbE family N-acetylglucosaminyl deacetylase
MITLSEITDSSALVVAHPDDEVLWFSSILEDVGNILVCFLDVSSRPDWSAGRRESLRSYPLEGVISLGLTESEVFNGAAWPNPVLSEFGLSVAHLPESLQGYSLETYKSNFERLKAELRPRLTGIRNVITHNPWGEYGHEEHVQVFRAVDALRSELGFRVWFSNYFSSKSYGLMLRYLAGFDGVYRVLKTRPKLGKRVQALYSRNNCWTWFSDYQWPENEGFLLWAGNAPNTPRAGTVFPMNAIRIEVPSIQLSEQPWRKAVGLILKRIRSRMFRGSSD